jgi:hypothetical protein
MQETICQAIRAKRLLIVHQHKTTLAYPLRRLVEPYALYLSEDETLILDSRFVQGDYETTPPPYWCPIPVDEITSVIASDHAFPVHPVYRPNHPRYTRALCRVYPYEDRSVKRGEGPRPDMGLLQGVC